VVEPAGRCHIARTQPWIDLHAQEKLEEESPGATIIPLIISSDKTQLTVFRNRSAYPVYLTIGNIPKETRRKPNRQAQLLLGYLPVSRLTGIKSDEVRRRALANLFHRCMKDILSPLERAGVDGVILMSGDGKRRRCHPIFATFVGDYPEQILVAGAKSGLCPKGVIDADLLGSAADCLPRSHVKAANALRKRSENPDDPVAYLEACSAENVKPIDAFWVDLPYADIYQSITPDILHQLYQGLVKHLVGWVIEAYGAEPIDARARCLPFNHQLRHFTKGISHLSRVSGTEHEDMCRILLGVIAELPVEDRTTARRVQLAVRAMLDYVHLAQFPEHSEESIEKLESALQSFHDSKEVFVDLGIREHFNLPKLHALRHYPMSMRLFGTADNFNTSYSERLHIDFAKSAYRSTNRKDEYPQMTLWLLRQEKMHVHARYLEWRMGGMPDEGLRPKLRHDLVLKRQIARYPNVKALSFAKAEETHGAKDFEAHLCTYIAKRNFPNLARAHVARIAATMRLPFRGVSAYHRIKYWHPDALERDSDLANEMSDCIHARPSHRDTQRRLVPGRFDTALVNENGAGGHLGVAGACCYG
jgi:hypothetical protein